MIDMAQADSGLRKDDRIDGIYMVRDFDGQVIAKNLTWTAAYKIVMLDIDCYSMVRTGNKAN